MITFDNNILDETFCHNAETISRSIHAISSILSKSNADEIYDTLNKIHKNKK